MLSTVGCLTRRTATVQPAAITVRSFHTSCSAESRRWKYLLRPDLKGDMHPKALLAKYDLSKPDERAEFNKVMYDNHTLWWRNVDPDEIVRRLTNVLANDYKRPNGGISLDMVRVLLQLAKTPQHVQVALQCVTVWQHNQPNWQQKQNMDRKVPIDIGKLICKAAIRVGAPEIGISWLQYYADQAEVHFLSKLAAGSPTKIPKSYQDDLPKGDEKKKDDDEDEDEEEVDESDSSSLAKKEKNKFNNWLANFMILVEELQSTKHNWTPNSESYAHIARFYAALGDVKNAIELFADHHSTEYARTWDVAIADIVLAMVYRGTLDEIPQVLKKASIAPTAKDAGEKLRRAYLSYCIATRNDKAILQVLETVSARDRLFKCHFGDKGAVEFLVQTLSALPEEQQNRLSGFVASLQEKFLKEEVEEEVEEEAEEDGEDKE